jgi:hypothetical protein
LAGVLAWLLAGAWDLAFAFSADLGLACFRAASLIAGATAVLAAADRAGTGSATSGAAIAGLESVNRPAMARGHNKPGRLRNAKVGSLRAVRIMAPANIYSIDKIDEC